MLIKYLQRLPSSFPATPWHTYVTVRDAAAQTRLGSRICVPSGSLIATLHESPVALAKAGEAFATQSSHATSQVVSPSSPSTPQSVARLQESFCSARSG